MVTGYQFSKRCTGIVYNYTEFILHKYHENLWYLAVIQSVEQSIHKT